MQNIDKQKASMKRWRLAHPNYRRNYYLTNKERELKQSMDYQKNDPKRHDIYRRKYYKKNQENILAKARLNYDIIERKTRYEEKREHILLTCKLRRHKLHSILIWHYSKGTYKCSCCGFGEGKIFLEIDHLNGNGNKHRKAIGVGNFHTSLVKHNLPNAYQVLCSNCNRAKFRNGGVCPHKEDANHVLSKTNI